MQPLISIRRQVATLALTSIYTRMNSNLRALPDRKRVSPYWTVHLGAQAQLSRDEQTSHCLRGRENQWRLFPSVLDLIEVRQSGRYEH